MALKEKNLLQKFAATLKKFSAQGAKKVEYGISCLLKPAGKDEVEACAALWSAMSCMQYFIWRNNIVMHGKK